MDPIRASQHATAVAREVVSAGLADKESVRRLYQDYARYVRQGVKGTFTQLLLSRGVIDQRGFERLEQTVPATDLGLAPPAQASSVDSSLVSGTSVARDTPPRPSGVGTVTPSSSYSPEQVLGGNTLGFDRVMTASGVFDPKIYAAAFADDEDDDLDDLAIPEDALPGGGPDRTIGFDQVISAAQFRDDDDDDDLDDDGMPPGATTTMAFGSVLPVGPKHSDMQVSGDSGSDPPPKPKPKPKPKPPAPSVSLGTTFEVLDYEPASMASRMDRIQSTAGSSLEDQLPPIGMEPSLNSFDPSSDEDDGLGLGSQDLFISDEDEDERVEPPKAGDEIDDYTLVDELGRGGMGVIFRARKGADGQLYALKVLLGAQDLGADRRRQRFRREVEAMRRMEHENIVKVYDYGRKGPFDWYTMDYIAGKDFEKLLEEGELEKSEKMQIFTDICAAMSHAHERNVIHRDLKPQNVLVDPQGRGHVLDFGLAKILDQGVGMTRTGSALGTPFYMAPEQLKSAKHIDSRADVFSLGVILYEITTGLRPFTGETAAEVGNHILTVDPPRPTTIKKDIHPDIDAMVIKALEKDPQRRYPDANALYADLVRHRKGFGVTGAKGVEGAVGEARRWATRNRAALIGGGIASAIFIPLLLVFALSSGNGDDPNGPGPQVVTVTPTPADGPTPPPETPPEGQRPTPTPAATPAGGDPTPTPSSTPGGTDSTPTPTPTPSPTPTPEATPEKARTPEEVARLRLRPAEEVHTTAGAEEASQANQSPESKLTLLLGLEAGVFPAMSIGDTERALESLRALKTNASVKIKTLAVEIENDVETLKRLRVLVGEIARVRPKALRSLSFYGGDKLRSGADLEVLDGGFIRLKGTTTWTVIDPCALRLADLDKLLIERDADNASAHYGIAVLGIYRGRSEDELDEHLTGAGGERPVQHRRRLAAWLERARSEAWQTLEDEASEVWRKLEGKRKTPSAFVRGLNDFIDRYGRTEAYQIRREELLKRLHELSSLSELLEGKNRRGGNIAAWNFRGDEARDFEVAPLEDDPNSKVPTPFRAEAQSNALALENGRVWLTLEDLETSVGMVEVSTNSNRPLAVFLSSVRQEVDPDVSWVVKQSGKQLAVDTRKRKLTKPKEITFERRGEGDAMERVFTIKPQDLVIPEKSVGRRRGRLAPELGAESQYDMRVTSMSLTWTDQENPEEASEFRQALLARRLVEQEARIGEREGFPLVTNVPGALQGFMYSGDYWDVEGDTLIAAKGGAIWTSQWAEYGVLRFKIAWGDGPGARLYLGDRPFASRSANWRLPATMNPEPNTFREVRCIFNLPAKVATVIVDGVRLATLSDRGVRVRRAFFGVEFIGRTAGKIRDLELVQFRPRKLR